MIQARVKRRLDEAKRTRKPSFSMLTDALRNQFDNLVQENNVVLFMKGNRQFPQCGFSAQVVHILRQLGVSFETVNVLADGAVREGIKEYSNWPTIPQLYIGGEFVGGCDIVKEMYASGELAKKLGVEVKSVAPPSISIEDAAANAIRAADEGNGEMLRLEITDAFQYDLYFGPKQAGDVVATSDNGISILFDAPSASRANGLHIRWVETADGDGAFKIENPNEPADA